MSTFLPGFDLISHLRHLILHDSEAVRNRSIQLKWVLEDRLAEWIDGLMNALGRASSRQRGLEQLLIWKSE